MTETVFLRVICIFCIASSTHLMSFSQQRLEAASNEFEAVSIHATDPHRTIEFMGHEIQVAALQKPCEYSRDRMTCRLPLWGLIREAFQLQMFALQAPVWTKEGMFDVQATMPLDTPKDTARLMLQAALKQQFGLQYHIDHKVTPIYALVAMPSGTKLTDYDPAHPKTTRVETPAGPIQYNQWIHAGQYFVSGTSLDIFAVNLRSVADLNRPVINETGLAGKYDIDIKWKSSADPDEVVHVIDKGILQAMQEQLGLMLVKKDAPVDYFFVDHANREPNQ